MNTTFTTVIPIVSGILIVATAVIGTISMPRGDRKRVVSRERKVATALAAVISCNNYPKLTKIFEQLDYDIEKYDVVVNDRFRGYFEDE